MDVILLAGGYATRMYPLTRDRPKALLPVSGRTILDHNVAPLENCGLVSRFFLVTNERFAADFRRWAGSRPAGAKPLEVLSDGTDSNENRLGAIGDLKFVLDTADADRSDFLYVAGTDNIARFDITGIIDLALERGSSAVFAYRYADKSRLGSKGVVTVDSGGRVERFVEKSPNPPGNLVVPPYYVYAPEAVAAVDTYIQEGNNPDAPGHFMSWLVRRHSVYAIVTEGEVIDIGTLDAYRAVVAQQSGEKNYEK